MLTPKLKAGWVAAVFVLTLVLAFPVSSQAAETIRTFRAIAMHGAPKYAPGFKNFDYVNAQAPKGGTLRTGGFGSFDSLNGFSIKGEVADGLSAIYDTLTIASADEPFTRYGLLAKSMEMPDDRSWIIFNLRSGARWHDGKPITAADVVWSFKELTTNPRVTPFYRFYYADVASVKALGRERVKFTFKPTGNRELPLIVGAFPILPKHYWTEKGKGRDIGKSTLEPPLGSGPYKIDKFEAGRYISYKRVAKYWGRNLNVNIGRNNFDVLRVEYFRDANVSVEGFKAGVYDFRAENISKVWATGYDIPAVKKGLIVKQVIYNQRTAPVQGYIYNIRRPLFQDRRVRAALAYAFDFKWTNKNLFYGQYKRSRSYFGNSELEARGLPKGRELKILEKYRGRIPNEVFTKEYNPPNTKTAGRIRANLRIADRLLKEAGWVIRGKDRVNVRTGQKMQFEIMLAQPAFERVTLPFAKNLQRLGVTVRVRTVDTAQYIKRLENFDFDMVVMSWGQSLSPGNEQRGYWGSAAARQNGSRNYIGVNDPVVDDLIKGLVSASDRTDLVARTRALDRVLQWGFYMIPHWYANYDRLIYWNKFSRPRGDLPYGYSTSRWWYDAQKARATAQGKTQPKIE